MDGIVAMFKFLIDPDQKQGLKTFFKTGIAFFVFLFLTIVASIKSYKIVSDQIDLYGSLQLTFINALPLGFTLTFFIYLILVILVPEEMFAAFKLTFFLLIIKAVTFSMTLAWIF